MAEKPDVASPFVECQFPPTPQPMVGDPSATTIPCAPARPPKTKERVGAARATPVALRARGAEQRHDPVAHHLVHGASVGWTASIMRSSTGSSSLRASSGSQPANSSIEPLMSAKRTTTCLRSPLSALRDARIFSTRCRGSKMRRGSSRFDRPSPPAAALPRRPAQG
jgi:hypothetical protein